MGSPAFLAAAVSALSVALHAAGDRGRVRVVDVLARAGRRWPDPRRRGRTRARPPPAPPPGSRRRAGWRHGGPSATLSSASLAQRKSTKSRKRRSRDTAPRAVASTRRDARAERQAQTAQEVKRGGRVLGREGERPAGPVRRPADLRAGHPARPHRGGDRVHPARGPGAHRRPDRVRAGRDRDHGARALQRLSLPRLAAGGDPVGGDRGRDRAGLQAQPARASWSSSWCRSSAGCSGGCASAFSSPGRRAWPGCTPRAPL